MRILVQKVTHAKVTIEENVHGSINNGLVLFVGFTKNDTLEDINYMIKKVLHLRIFEDENHKMNLSVLDVGGEILSISQFTLYADTTKGNRPSYMKALTSIEANPLYEEFNNLLRKQIHVETGRFGSDMKVELENDGPTTIWLDSKSDK